MLCFVVTYLNIWMNLDQKDVILLLLTSCGDKVFIPVNSIALTFKLMHHVDIFYENTISYISRLLVMGEFCKHFMSRAYSSQVYHYILPCIRAESQLPLTEVLSALRYNNTDSLVTGKDKPTLLHSLMSIFSPNIGKKEIFVSANLSVSHTWSAEPSS